MKSQSTPKIEEFFFLTAKQTTWNEFPHNPFTKTVHQFWSTVLLPQQILRRIHQPRKTKANTTAPHYQHTQEHTYAPCHTTKSRPSQPRSSPYTTSPPRTMYNTQKPIRVDTPRKYNVKNKMTSGENSHNTSNKKAKHWRSRTFYSQHQDKATQYLCHPQFNQQHHAPTPVTSFPRPSHRALRRKDEIKKSDAVRSPQPNH